MRLTTTQIQAVHKHAAQTGNPDIAALTLTELSNRGALCAEGCGVPVSHPDLGTASVAHVDCDIPEQGAVGPAEGYQPSPLGLVFVL